MTLVNAHTHLELSDAGHLLPEPSADFMTWISGVMGHADRPAEIVQRACELGVRKLLEAGTTHVGDISATGLSVEPLSRSGLEGIVWIEVLGVPEQVAHRQLDKVKRRIEELREVAANSRIRVGITLHAPYTLHPSVWEPAIRWIEAEQVPLCIHLGESPAEWELLTTGAGPFLEFARKMNFPDLALPRATPVEYIEQQGALSVRPMLVHMTEVSDDDIERVRRSGAIVVHCPRSNERLQCRRMPLEKYLAAGVPVLLGTDSLSSSPSIDVREEQAFAVSLHRGWVAPGILSRMARDASTFQNHYR